MYCLSRHGNTVIVGDGLELPRDAASCLDLARHHMAEVFQVGVTGTN